MRAIAGTEVGAPDIHLSGEEAIALLGIEPSTQPSSVSAKYEVIVHTRRLSILTSAFASLRSPDTLTRKKAGGRQRDDDLMVATLVEPGDVELEGSGHPLRYRRGELLITSNTDEYLGPAFGPVAAAGVLIPRRLLGTRRRVLKRVEQPYIASSLLARSTAAFLAGFAVSVATGVIAEPSAETEQAVLGLVISVLSESPGRDIKLTDPAFVREAVADLIERYYSDPDFGVDVIADALHLSRRQVYRYFEATEQSLAARIADRRLQAAVDLLETQPRMSVSALARQSGFASEAAFRSRFRAGLGYGPTEARVRVLNGEALPTIGPAD